MATEAATTSNALTSQATALAGSTKSFLLAHPIGVAIVGGIIVGTGTYYAVKYFTRKKEEEPQEAAAAAS
jgi:hypothetical protein